MCGGGSKSMRRAGNQTWVVFWISVANHSVLGSHRSRKMNRVLYQCRTHRMTHPWSYGGLMKTGQSRWATKSWPFQR